MSGNFYATYPIASAAGASWKKITTPYTQLTSLPGTDSGPINLLAVPAGYAVAAIAWNVTSNFSGDTVTLSLGNTINGASAYYGGVTLASYPLVYQPGGNNAGGDFNNGLGPISFLLSDHVTAEFTVTTALSSLTAGSIDFYIQLQNMTGG